MKPMTKEQQKMRMGHLSDKVKSYAKQKGLNCFMFLESNDKSGASINGYFSEPFIEGLLLTLMHHYPAPCVRVFSTFSTLANQQNAGAHPPPTQGSPSDEQQSDASSASQEGSSVSSVSEEEPLSA